MPAHGLDREEELGGDTHRRGTVGKHLENLELARRQVIAVGHECRELAAAILTTHLIDEHGGELARQRRLAAEESAQRALEALGRLVLAQQAGRTGAQRPQDDLAVRRRAEHDDPALARDLVHPCDRRDRVAIGELDVEQHDIGKVLPGQQHGLVGCQRGSHHVERAIVEHGDQPTTVQITVLAHENRDPRSVGPIGGGRHGPSV